MEKQHQNLGLEAVYLERALIFLLFLFSLLILFFLHLALIADSETEAIDVLLPELKTGHSGLNRPSRLSKWPEYRIGLPMP